MVKLSIIVPIYNVAQYLCKCVDSLLAQDYPASEYEIILVDDGSPDECPQICDSYAATHKNIRAVHRENGGLSAARNSGIEVAHGEYLMFVDGDDYIEPNVLGTLIKRMDELNLDVLRYNYQNVNDKYEVFQPFKAAKRDVDYSESVTNGETFLNERLGSGCYAWQFVIKRCLIVDSRKSIVERQDCLFKEGIFFEDTEWTPRMLVRAKRVASTRTIVYDYLWREGSISLPTDPIKRKKVIEDKIALINGFNEQSRMVKDPMWFTWMTSTTAMSVLGMLSTMSSQERKPYLRELKSLRIFPLSTQREKVLSHKVKTILANISPSLYCTLMSSRK